MTPHYLAYCRAHNRTPDEQMAFDTEHWPGGKMIGFISWMNQQLLSFAKAHPEAFIANVNGTPNIYGLIDHEAWGQWLNTQADARVQLQ